MLQRSINWSVIEMKDCRPKSSIEPVGDVRCLVAVMVGDDIVVQKTVSHQIRICRTPEESVLGIVYGPRAKRSVIGRVCSIGKYPVNIMISIRVRQLILGEIVGYLLNVRVI